MGVNGEFCWRALLASVPVSIRAVNAGVGVGVHEVWMWVSSGDVSVHDGVGVGVHEGVGVHDGVGVHEGMWLCMSGGRPVADSPSSDSVEVGHKESGDMIRLRAKVALPEACAS